MHSETAKLTCKLPGNGGTLFGVAISSFLFRLNSNQLPEHRNTSSPIYTTYTLRAIPINTFKMPAGNNVPPMLSWTKAKEVCNQQDFERLACALLNSLDTMKVSTLP